MDIVAEARKAHDDYLRGWELFDNDAMRLVIAKQAHRMIRSVLNTGVQSCLSTAFYEALWRRRIERGGALYQAKVL